MKVVAALAVLAAVLLVVHADFYVDLFYEPKQKYLSSVSYGGVWSYLRVVKSSTDGFTSLKFVKTGLGLSDGQIAIQPSFGANKVLLPLRH